MPDFSAAILATGAGSTTLPMASLYAAAGGGCAIREISVYNTTTVAVDMAVRRLTTAGTQGAGFDEMEWDPGKPPPLCTGFQAHSGAPTIAAGFIRRYQIPGVVGNGIQWVFGGKGLVIPEGTGQGIGVIPANGTGQICIVEFVWEE